MALPPYDGESRRKFRELMRAPRFTSIRTSGYTERPAPDPLPKPMPLSELLDLVEKVLAREDDKNRPPSEADDD